jgi:hypothetical protein
VVDVICGMISNVGSILCAGPNDFEAHPKMSIFNAWQLTVQRREKQC